MPSRRDQIRMTDAELRDYLRTSKTMIIVSIGPGGFPHPMPMWYAVDGDGTVRMTTFRKSQKVRNIERDPRVSLLVESGGGDYGQLRGVAITGKAQIVDDLAEVTKTLRRVSGAEELTDPAAQKGADAFIGKTAAKRVAILIRPEKIVSWDHRKLGGGY